MPKPFPYAGYHQRPDGFFAKTLTFLDRGKRRDEATATETIVRDRKGRIVRVERSKQAASYHPEIH